MDQHAIAQKLAELGKREFALLKQLEKVHADRCALLQDVARQTGSAPIAALSVEPKDKA